MDLDELPASATVVRLVSLKGVFLPNGAGGLPIGEAFVPTRSDKNEASERGGPVLVSVWDEARTTLAQAQGFRERDATVAGRQPPETIPFWFRVCDIRSVAPDRLRVLRDPRPSADGAGAEGHCGIAGLEKRPGEKSGEGKVRWRAMLDRLAEMAERKSPGQGAG